MLFWQISIKINCHTSIRLIDRLAVFALVNETDLCVYPIRATPEHILYSPKMRNLYSIEIISFIACHFTRRSVNRLSFQQDVTKTSTSRLAKRTILLNFLLCATEMYRVDVHWYCYAQCCLFFTINTSFLFVSSTHSVHQMLEIAVNRPFSHSFCLCAKFCFLVFFLHEKFLP